MKRCKRRKFFIIVVLSLTLCMGFFSSYAAVTEDDASITFKRTPISAKGWIAYVNSSNVSTQGFSDAYFNSTIQGGNAGFLWRITGNFDNYTDFVHNRLMSIIGWSFDSTLDFNVDFVYQFRLQIRYGNTNGQSLYSDADLSKLYLGFSSDQSFYMKHTFTQSEATAAISALFSPSSYTVSGNYIELVYNIPIYPTSNFPEAVTDVDNGVTYVPVYNMYLWNYNSGLDYFSTNGTLTRMQYTIFPRSASDASVFTPSEWQTRVQQQGFDDISQAVQQAASDIINAGDPVDISSLEQAHETEHQLVNGINTTFPYNSTGTQRLFELGVIPVSTTKIAAVSSWLNYAYSSNPVFMVVVYSSLAAAVIYMCFKAVM